MKHSVGTIFLCWGSHNRVCIGCVFFEKGESFKVVYSDTIIRKTLKAFFPNTTFGMIDKFVPSEKLTRSYWDGYLWTNMNGMIQVQETKPYAWSENLNYDKFAKAIIG